MFFKGAMVFVTLDGQHTSRVWMIYNKAMSLYLFSSASCIAWFWFPEHFYSIGSLTPPPLSGSLAPHTTNVLMITSGRKLGGRSVPQSPPLYKKQEAVCSKHFLFKHRLCLISCFPVFSRRGMTALDWLQFWEGMTIGGPLMSSWRDPVPDQSYHKSDIWLHKLEWKR